jgi:hypothetical protein
MLTPARRICLVFALPFLALALQFWPESKTGTERSFEERVADSHFDDGVQALARADSDGAISSFTDAIDRYLRLRSSALREADVEMSRAHRGGGFSAGRLAHHVDEELRLMSKLADAHCQRGVAYNRKGDFALALADFREASKTKTDRTVIEGRALANRHLGNEKAAEADEQYLQVTGHENSNRKAP